MGYPLAWNGVFMGVASSLLKRATRTKSISQPVLPSNKYIPVEGIKKLPTTGILSFGFQRSDHIHNGIDIPAKEGTNVLAASSGKVEYATTAWRQGFTGYGNVVVIKNSDGTYALYAHLKRPLVDVGDNVEAGEIIGEVGVTQYSSTNHNSNVKSGPHLHFEISPRKYPQANTQHRLNPLEWLSSGLNA